MGSVLRELRRPHGYVAATAVGILAGVAGLPWPAAVAIAVVALLAGAVVAPWSSRAASRASTRSGVSRRGGPAPAPGGSEAMFRLEGEYWTIAYGAATFRLHDAKGLGYIHRLLSTPGVEVHVVDLVTLGRTEPAAHRDDPSREDLHVGTKAEPVIDAQAREAYRRRIEDLEDQIEEAEANGDPERASRARDELDFIAAELHRQLRGDGSSRTIPDATERARINASRAIRASIAKIAEQDASLGHHLDHDIRTGTYCSYVPDPVTAPAWRL